jgi:hypothetical protein
MGMCEKIPETDVNIDNFIFYFIKYKNITILLFIMGLLFSKIEKFFDKKYKYNYGYDNYEFDSIVKNEQNENVNDEDEEFSLIDSESNSQTRINYYNKKLEGILYLS